MKINDKDISPEFDGHLEKPLGKMTPREKIHYLWLQMEFIYTVNKLKKNSTTKS